MTKEETLAAAEVMRRAANGEAVEMRSRLLPDGEWEVVNNVGWNWNEREYRIVEAPRYRPWTADEVPVGAVIRIKGTPRHRMQITGWSASTRRVLIGGGSDIETEDLFDKWEMLDGSPCGVKL